MGNIILEIEKAILGIYKENKLLCLRGMDNKCKLNGKEITTWYFDVTRESANKYNGQFSYLKNLDDILLCSDELLYYTAHLFLYRPFINNPILDRIYFSGGYVYPNYQNLESKRYFMYADVASQCVYNFWDRIGDLIASFFPDKIKSHQVFFGTALQAVPEEFRKSAHYIWLDNFNNTSYRELNSKRKEVVHYATSDTGFKYQHLGIANDRGQIELLQAEREGLPEYYKNHISLSINGFEQTLLLLEEISTKIYSSTSNI